MKTTQIEPSFGYRFSPTEIRSTYKSASQAFDSGDYLNAAQMADGDDDLQGCALILSGLVDTGLAALEATNSLSERGVICKAFALWILERNQDAISLLENARDRFPSGKVDIFLNLLHRNEITAFITSAMLPLHSGESATAREPIHKYGPIVAKYVGSQMPQNAYDYCPADPFDSFIAGLPEDERPDFIFAASPQWIVPKNLNKVAIPTVLWAHDGDVFLYRNVDNFALYDVTICECSQLHFELSNSASSQCVSNIIFHPLAAPFPEAPVNSDRDIDILFTGSSLTQFHSEKPRFIYLLSELGARYRVKVVDGHLPEQDYFGLLARARFVPLLNRYAGAPSPRWRDALASGAGIFFPKGTFYDLIAPGCFAIRDEAMIDDMRAHLDLARSGAAAYDNARIAREVNTRFEAYRQPHEKLFERLLKYAAFMALVWKGKNAATPSQDRRLVWLTPRTDASIYGRSNILSQMTSILARTKEKELRDDIDYNNVARLHSQLVHCFGDDPRVLQWRSAANYFFSQGLRRFPNSLLLRFNEAYWHYFGRVVEPHDLIKKFQAIIDDFDSLDFNVRGSDVGFAYTLSFVDTIFPCYEYGDLVTDHLVRQNAPALDLKVSSTVSPSRTILAACHGYVAQLLNERGEIEDAISQLEKALDIFPNNLPLSIECLEKLIFYSRTKMGRRLKLQVAQKLAYNCLTVANFYPTILLTHADQFVPILIHGKQKATARVLVAAWYRLQNVIYEPTMGRAPYRDIAKLAVFTRYRSLFPKNLSQRLRAVRNGQIPYAELTQVEQMLFDLTRLNFQNTLRRLNSDIKPAVDRLSRTFEAVSYLRQDIRNPPNPQHSRIHRRVHFVMRSIFYLPFSCVPAVFLVVRRFLIRPNADDFKS